ncbi:MAG: DUF423 domain-containing protein, partial [Candidatus Riflebacteria bacterium]|nr:DUF423 domain-containing protein [Candidatus Riflebacteria bacterium]
MTDAKNDHGARPAHHVEPGHGAEPEGAGPGDPGPGDDLPASPDRPALQGADPQEPDPHGPLYYLCRNLARMVWQYPAARTAVKVLPVVGLVALYLLRFLLYPVFVAVRQRSPTIVGVALALLIIGLTRRFAPRRRWLTLGSMLLAAGVCLVLLLAPVDIVRELSLYVAYNAVDRRPLTRLPLTIKERVYPLTMVDRIVEDRLTGSHYDVSKFEMMRHQNRLYWTAQKTPVGLVNRASLEDVQGVVRVDAGSVAFEMKHFDVKFAHGRDMPLMKDLVHYALPRELSLVDLFDKQIDSHDVTYIQTDGGDWVQVVALIDWDGIFPFTYPRFGGVFVVPERDKGSIRLYRPEEIEKVPFLKDQNLLPEAISDFYAEAWKFNQGFWGWFRRRGITKITQIPEDTNPQPFTVYFKDVAGQEGMFQFY